MDANGQRLYQWSFGPEHRHPAVETVVHDPVDRTLSLRPLRSDVPIHGAFPVARDEAELARNIVPDARDRYGTANRVVDVPVPQVLAVGGGRNVDTVDEITDVADITDHCIGDDEIHYLARAGQVVLRSLVQTFSPISLSLADFAAERIAAAPGGGVWALDRVRRRLARTVGAPYPDFGYTTPAWGTFRPSPENPYPPRLVAASGSLELGARDPADVRIAEVAVSLGGRVAVVGWHVPTGDSLLWLRASDIPGDSDGADEEAPRIIGPFVLPEVRFAFSIRWRHERQIAVLTPQDTPLREAFVFDLVERGKGSLNHPPFIVLYGGRFPLNDWGRTRTPRPFVQAPLGELWYATDAGFEAPSADPEDWARPDHRRLLPLSLVHRSAEGHAALPPIDCGNDQQVWHRVYLEGVLPPGTGVRLELATADRRDAAIAESAWHPHAFGVVPSTPDSVPRATWFPMASEVPHHPGLLDRPLVPTRSGVFSVLVQRVGRRVSRLVGRYLFARVHLFGDGRKTPCIHAIRVYGSRFSFVEQYLPRLYHEEVHGPDGDAAAPETTQADFLERFLSNFEGVLTPIEDRIAHADVLTHPYGAPDDALPWLAAWVGLVLEGRFPRRRWRRAISEAMTLHRWHGTQQGLERALEIATDGISTGQVLVVEDYRLRRILATILGVRLARRDDPLLPGLTRETNSIVGDTLFLGDAEQNELLALFDPSGALSGSAHDAVVAFLEDLAFSVTVLVRPTVDRELVEEIVAFEIPTHVRVQVVQSSRSLIVGLRSLVGVDTHLLEGLEFGQLRVDESRLGVRDVLRRPKSLDGRLEGDST